MGRYNVLHSLVVSSPPTDELGPWRYTTWAKHATLPYPPWLTAADRERLQLTAPDGVDYSIPLDIIGWTEEHAIKFKALREKFHETEDGDKWLDTCPERADVKIAVDHITRTWQATIELEKVLAAHSLTPMAYMKFYKLSQVSLAISICIKRE